MKRALAFLPMLILVLLASPVSAQAGKGEKITSLPLTNPVTVDGKWTTADEWSDGVSIQCGTFGWIALKDDTDFLYVLVDYTGDTRAAADDFAWLLWDQKNDGGNKPKTDDYDLILRYTDKTRYASTVAKGTGTSWGTFKPASSLGIAAASSTNATNDPYSKASHLAYEFRVPRLILDNSTVITTIGFSAGAQDAGGVWFYLPAWGQYMIPDTWDQLTFSVPIPEFSTTWLIIAASALSVIVMFRSCKKMKLPYR